MQDARAPSAPPPCVQDARAPSAPPPCVQDARAPSAPRWPETPPAPRRYTRVKPPSKTAGDDSLFSGPHEQEERPDQAIAPLPGLHRKPYLTWGLLGVFLLVWLVAEMRGGSTDAGVLLSLGAMNGDMIAAGDYWRLFTATFVHSGLLHLGFNCMALFIFGQQLEVLFGRIRYLVLYVIAGLAGSVASYSLNISVTPGSIGVGASGAIFGVLGGLVAFYAANRAGFGMMGRQTLTALLVIVAINVLFGFAFEGVDNYAHIGGFVSGLVLGLALSPRFRLERDMFGLTPPTLVAYRLRAGWLVVPPVVLILLGGVLLGDMNAGDSPVSHLRMAEELYREGEITQALDELAMAIEAGPDYGPAFLRRGVILAELGNTDMAISDLAHARRLKLSESESRQALRLLVELSSRRR